MAVLPGKIGGQNSATGPAAFNAFFWGKTTTGTVLTEVPIMSGDELKIIQSGDLN